MNEKILNLSAILSNAFDSLFCPEFILGSYLTKKVHQTLTKGVKNQGFEKTFTKSANLELWCKQINTNQLFCLMLGDAEMMKVKISDKRKEIAFGVFCLNLQI